VIDGGHRVLVFSQFVTMLGLLREKLTENAIEFCYLDGSTTNRSQVVERFQTSGIPVFLISLKAGGVGLNLTGADTVIHFDPWWNPAVEEQASDRAHRIGQTRVVTSYKLITATPSKKRFWASRRASVRSSRPLWPAKSNWQKRSVGRKSKSCSPANTKVNMKELPQPKTDPTEILRLRDGFTRSIC